MEFFPSSTASGGSHAQDGVVVQAVHSDGLTRVVHAPRASHREGAVERLFTGGDDFLVRILPCQMDSAVEPLVIDDATRAITWIDADSDYLVTGSEDGCVRIYQHTQPVSDMESQATSPTDLVCLLARSSLPIRCVAIEAAVSSGKTPRVAICSDELVVKVVDAGDPKRVQLLTGHARGLRAASWHPLKPQLITCACDGSVKIWDLSTTEPVCIKTLEGTLPSSSSQSENTAQALYHPSGDFIVMPSKTYELVAVSATDFKRVGSFVVGSDSSIDIPTGQICSFAFSPNGRYLASATTDGKVTIWESETRRAIRSISRTSIKTGLSWHGSKNALAWTDTMGQLSRWTDVVPSAYPSPCEVVEYLPASQVRKKKQREEIDDLFGDAGIDGDEEEDFSVADADANQHQPPHQYRAKDRDSRVVHPPRQRALVSFGSDTKSQASFQPTSTPMRSGRRYLCLNMIGSLMAIEQDSQQSISFESHDVSTRRNWRFVDHFGYDMAAVGATGALLACPSKEGEAQDSSDEEEDDDDDDTEGTDGRKKKRKGHTSSIYYKPFEAPGAWSSSGSEWHVNLPKGERAVAVAIGGRKGKIEAGGVDSVCAIVATSTGYLRFFSASGMQRYIWAFGSQVVSMAAGNRSLLIVHRGSTSTAAEQYQNLSYTLIDLTSLAVRQEGTLPLAKGSSLTWLGFNDLDYPAVFDSRQVLYLLDRSFGPIGQARWMPVLDGSAVAAEGGARLKYWPVGLDSSSLMTVFLKGNGLAYPDPSSSSRPLIQQLELKMPLLDTDTPMGALEEQYLRNVQMASLVRAYQASLSEQDDDAGEIPDLPTPASLEHESDKALLQLVQLSCKSDKHQRVLDAARELHNTRTLDAALQIAAFFHLSSLVDRMGSLRGWVASRRERDEEMAWSGAAAAVMQQAPTSRVLVGSSQSPSLDARAKKSAAAAVLSSEFAPRPRKSYGEGGRSDLARVGQTPSNTWSSRAESPDHDRHSDKENVVMAADGQQQQQPHSRGQKRGAEEEDAVHAESGTEEAEKDSSASTNPFANKTKKVSSAKNPFARTAGMTRDRSMHKSSSFFERVDASTLLDSQNDSSSSKSKAPSRAKQQTTLFLGLAKAKSKATTATSTASPSPVYAMETDDGPSTIKTDSESLQLTLRAAARREEESIGLQDTQFQPVDDDEDEDEDEDEDNEGGERRFDSLPVDVTV